MHRIDAPAATPAHLFTDGDPFAGIPATVLDADWLNAVQEEVCTVIEGAGIGLVKANRGQLAAAIAARIAAALPTGLGGWIRRGVVYSGTTLSINLPAGTWLVDATAGIFESAMGAESLAIDGTVVHSMPDRGDPAGADIHPLAGFLEVVIASPRDVVIAFSQPSGGTSFPTFIKAIAYRLA